MLATQVLFVEVFAQQRNETHVVRNLDAFWWIHRHRDEIEQRVRRP